MGTGIKTRMGGPAAARKAKKSEDHILLARGLSARYCGANTPLTGLTADEMERDLRHMEAFSNACIAYAQQYYIYQNKTENDEKSPKSAPPAPLIAMPVRIDPEEEKRLMNLRQKIQHCEAQREVLESQYLSLRAHYVYLSQKLKTFRKTVNGRAEFLQEMVGKRGKLLALLRARLQMTREVFNCLKFRQNAKLEDDSMEEDGLDLVEVWNEVDEQFKKAEQDCRSESGKPEPWHALKVPSIPPGVPLYLSQVAKQPALAAAWGTGGMFGSNPNTLCWIPQGLPEEVPNRGKELPSLREEVDFLKRELDRERSLNKDLQTNIISRRKRNDELIAMMALLRTETEAVIARHNILLESDQAKEAAYKLHQEEMNRDGNKESNGEGAGVPDVNAQQGELPASHDSTLDKETGETEEEGETESVSDLPVTKQLDAATGSSRATKDEDNENDGDDEGAGEEEDDEEGEILEGEDDNGAKRSIDVEENGSPRTKRRKL